jgi:hypothetical protein
VVVAERAMMSWLAIYSFSTLTRNDLDSGV